MLVNLLLLLLCLQTVAAFLPRALSSISRSSSSRLLSEEAKKGFGKAKEVVVQGMLDCHDRILADCASEEEKDAGTKTYESMAKRGVPEYSIFLRPLNGSETGEARRLR